MVFFKHDQYALREMGMFLLSAPTNLQKDLHRFNHPLSIHSQFKSVTDNYGRLNLIYKLNSVFRINANKLKAMAFMLHRREKKQCLARVNHVPTIFKKIYTHKIILLPCLLKTKLGPTRMNTSS